LGEEVLPEEGDACLEDRSGGEEVSHDIVFDPHGGYPNRKEGHRNHQRHDVAQPHTVDVFVSVLTGFRLSQVAAENYEYDWREGDKHEARQQEEVPQHLHNKDEYRPK